MVVNVRYVATSVELFTQWLEEFLYNFCYMIIELEGDRPSVFDCYLDDNEGGVFDTYSLTLQDIVTILPDSFTVIEEITTQAIVLTDWNPDSDWYRMAWPVIQVCWRKLSPTRLKLFIVPSSEGDPLSRRLQEALDEALFRDYPEAKEGRYEVSPGQLRDMSSEQLEESNEQLPAPAEPSTRVDGSDESLPAWLPKRAATRRRWQKAYRAMRDMDEEWAEESWDDDARPPTLADYRDRLREEMGWAPSDKTVGRIKQVGDRGWLG